jgi:hypothetical protein
VIRLAEIGAERMLNPELTLSEGGVVEPDPDRTRSEPEIRPSGELTSREYAELAHISESELRSLWGDR